MDHTITSARCIDTVSITNYLCCLNNKALEYLTHALPYTLHKYVNDNIIILLYYYFGQQLDAAVTRPVQISRDNEMFSDGSAWWCDSSRQRLRWIVRHPKNSCPWSTHLADSRLFTP